VGESTRMENYMITDVLDKWLLTRSFSTWELRRLPGLSFEVWLQTVDWERIWWLASDCSCHLIIQVLSFWTIDSGLGQYLTLAETQKFLFCLKCYFDWTVHLETIYLIAPFYTWKYFSSKLILVVKLLISLSTNAMTNIGFSSTWRANSYQFFVNQKEILGICSFLLNDRASLLHRLFAIESSRCPLIRLKDHSKYGSLILFSIVKFILWVDIRI